jgi:glucose/arabinose dehydrogenase
VAEKSGIIRLVKNGQVVATPLLNIDPRVNDYWDHGLIGLTLDPNFSSNGFIYVVYTYEDNASNYSGTKTARLSRFTVVGDVAAASSEVVLVGTVTGDTCDDFPVGTDCIPSDGSSHSVGNVRFGTDGKLYATFGDAASFTQVDNEALRAQDVDWLSGKVIRINPDGTGVADNPFWNGNANANRSKVWAYGVRNAFRFNFEPQRGTLYLGDVGWNEREEINVVRRGSNLGWPCYEGSVPQSGYESKPTCQALYAEGSGAVTAPAVDWTHNEGGCCGAAAVGGAFTTSYSAPFDDAYFYADYSKNWMRYFQVDEDDNIVGGVQDFLEGANGPVSLQRGLNGEIYYLAINTGEIRHIQEGSGNQPPTAVLSAAPTDGLAPVTVAFSGAGSTDPNFQPLTFAWDFGDGQQGSGVDVSHQYTVNGTYVATLTVTDSQGASDSATTTITVGNRSPSVSILSPADESTYVVGQTINLQGVGCDLDDGGPLPDGAFTWRITLFHNTHTHPFLTLTGASNSFVIPDHGDNSYAVIELDGVDSGGLHKVASVTIRPQTLQFTLDTSPAGLNVVYDGVLVQAPVTFTTIANSTHTIEAPTPQGISLFTSWSDGAPPNMM